MTESRQSRRRGQTRASLVRAAQELLATGGGREVSIQEITARADVGFGSFFNHFETKSELFEEAILQALDDHGAWLESVLAHEADPAVVFATSLRLTGRLQATNPTLAGVLRQALGPLLLSPRGLAPRARRDLVRAAAAGRLVIGDPDVALACVAGALVGTLHLVASVPRLNVDEATDDMVARVLRSFDVEPQDVARILALPLPAALRQPEPESER